MIAARIERYGPYLAGLAVLLAFVLFIAAAGYNIYHQRATDSALCRSNVQNRMALRLVFEQARTVFKETSENPKQVDIFFDRILQPIPPLECVGNQPVPKEG